MDLYNIWCDLKPGIRDTEFQQKLASWMDHLKARGLIEGYRLTRRKLGLGHPALGEFHVAIEVRDLAQLDQAFHQAAARRDPAETAHFEVNSLVTNFTAALYRDFPDPVRHGGDEKF